jgi:hypothetical protein
MGHSNIHTEVLSSTLVANASVVKIPAGSRHHCCGVQIQPHDVHVVFSGNELASVVFRCPVHHIDGPVIELPLPILGEPDDEDED